MLSKPQKAFALRWLAIAAGAYIAVSLLTLGYQIAENPEKAQSAREYISAFFAVPNAIRSMVLWFFNVLDRNHDDIAAASTIVVAAFTAVLGLFTVSLARSTRIAADASRLQAEALIAAELPIFSTPTVTIDFGVVGHAISFTNYGRTPAIVTADCLVETWGNKLSADPRYPIRSIRKRGIDDVTDNLGTFTIERTAPRDLTALSYEEWRRVGAHEIQYWVYGFFEYLDFRKARHREGFCFHYWPEEGGGGRWLRNGARGYTYNKIVEEEETGEGS